MLFVVIIGDLKTLGYYVSSKNISSFYICSSVRIKMKKYLNNNMIEENISQKFRLKNMDEKRSILLKK